MDVDAASDCDAVEDGDDAGKAGSGDDRVLLLLSSALHDEASSALVVVAGDDAASPSKMQNMPH